MTKLSYVLSQTALATHYFPSLKTRGLRLPRHRFGWGTTFTLSRSSVAGISKGLAPAGVKGDQDCYQLLSVTTLVRAF